MTIARLVVLAAIVTATPAHAQSVEAEVLFRDGKTLMKDGKIGEACDKFDASDRAEPSVGTELNLADCREKNGQLATSWAVFRKAAVAAKTAGDAKREAEARRRASRLEPRLAYLTILVPDASRIDGLQVARNGTTIDPELWNQGVPVDPGDYEISGQAPGHERWSAHVTIASDGQKASVEVPRVKPFAETKPASEPAPVVPAPVVARPAQPEATPTTFTSMRKIAIAVAAVGVIGIATGAVFGSKANSLETQSDATCPTSVCNDPHALQLNLDAHSDARVANIGIIAGGALVAGGVVLWFVGAPRAAHDEVAITPVLAPGALGLSATGSF
jgi:hypothetical protein